MKRPENQNVTDLEEIVTKVYGLTLANSWALPQLLPHTSFSPSMTVHKRRAKAVGWDRHFTKWRKKKRERPKWCQGNCSPLLSALPSQAPDISHLGGHTHTPFLLTQLLLGSITLYNMEYALGQFGSSHNFLLNLGGSIAPYGLLWRKLTPSWPDLVHQVFYSF